MSARSRLPAPYGRLIDRSREIGFRFDCRDYHGHPGDTIASALAGAGERILSRSFKYRRPRGVLSLSGFDANALVQLGPTPNVCADTFPLAPGLPDIESQNRVGTAARDRGAWTGFAKRFLPVGFYYRSFFKPAGAWAQYERIFRARAGLGRVDLKAAHEITDKQQLFCDVAIVGGGWAGMMAALEAARAGSEVCLVEAMPRLGGAALYGPDAEFREAEALVREVQAETRIRVLTDAMAQGLFEGPLLAVETLGAAYKIRSNRICLATGAYEQPVIFRNNDLPGIMLASAARRLLWLYGVKPGSRAVVVTVNDDGLETARQLADAGVEVEAVADLRAERTPLHDVLAVRGAGIHLSSAIHEAFAVPGIGAAYFGGPVEAVQLARLHTDGRAEPFGGRLECDLVVMAGGYVPAAGLACHRGARLIYDEALNSLRPEALAEGVSLAGSAAGAHAKALNHPFPVIPHPKGGEFVDLDEDLTIADIENAIADGFAHGELLKRYSTAGMGPSQGRQSALAVLRIAARANGVGAAGIGATTVRPPLTGESMGHLAGLSLHPYQRTPMHERHLALGAEMMPAGLWHRPAFYGAPGERDAAVAAEALAVRKGVGLIDVSTLGKIEVMGPDAGRFLDAVYVTTHGGQPVGRARYALRCDVGGSIADDGVVCCLADDFYYLTTTSGQATASHRHMLWLKAQWQMDFEIINVTGAYAAVNIAGPLARAVLAKLNGALDLGAGAFPYMAARTGTLGGIPVRLIRVGFVGELSYEIHAPALCGEALWEMLMEAGAEFGIKPFGVEAQRLLRLEKGHAIIGQDTDGLTTPHEANMAWALPKRKADYWGRAAIAARVERGRERLLVGFRLLDDRASPPPENCLVIEEGRIAGRVTSAARSDICGGVIGLCFLPPDRAKPGSTFQIKLPDGQFIAASVAALPFYDPDHARQTG
jgi:sarcosine oxidase, subunit alpha